MIFLYTSDFFFNCLCRLNEAVFYTARLQGNAGSVEGTTEFTVCKYVC